MKLDALTASAKLRHLAEAQLQNQSQPLLAEQAAFDLQLLSAELQIHQIELEMQNAELRDAQAAVEASAARYTDFYDFSPTGFVSLARDGTVLQINLAGTRLLGWERDHLKGGRFGTLLIEATRPAFNTLLLQVFGDEGQQQCEVVLMRADQALRTLQIEATLSADKQECLAVMTDITERKQAEELLRVSVEHLRAIIDTTPECIKLLSADGRLIEMNDAGLAMIEADSLDQVIHASMPSLLLPEHREAFQALTKSVIQGNKGMLVFEIQGLKGTRRWLETRAAPMIMRTGETVLLGITRDITENKQSDELIWKQANFDTLTDLPNRRMFYDRLAQEIIKSDRTNSPLAVLLIDLDEFKEVNDTLGHDHGDILLQATAHRIADCIRASDTLARLGGDEFIVVLSQLGDTHYAEDIAQKILNRLAEPFQLANAVTHVSASIGITLYPNDATEIQSLMKNADQAMYLSKSLGRNRFSHYTPELQETAQKRLRLTNDLREALAANQFQVYYQPIVTLATGSIHKAEALIRWHHPVHGIVGPAEFIPLAEATGLIVDIGFWVFQQAARQVKRWRQQCNPNFQISVNRSPVEFHHFYTTQHLPCDQYLVELELPGQSIVYEITEGVLLNNDTRVADTFKHFRDSKIQTALDDFGTGYSSLSYLKKFDIDFLKIDKSFIDHMTTDANDLALCEAIIVMAHKLGLKVIAEGVETEDQRKLLADSGCDYAQGYLFSKPVPPDEFEKILGV